MRVDAIALLFLTVLMTAAPAHAYVDPGTGGMLVQLVTGGVAGLLVLVRLYWARIVATFRKNGPPPVDLRAGARPGHEA